MRIFINLVFPIDDCTLTSEPFSDPIQSSSSLHISVPLALLQWAE